MMTEDVKVSIITVCYNSEKTIRKTIESVLYQTYANVEYILVDGKSTDGTLGIIEEYVTSFKEQGKKLIVISEEDSGLYDAMNKGIRLSAGDIIGIINSDDYYEKDAVESVVNAWDRKGMQILHGLMRSFQKGREYSVALTSAEFLPEKMIQHPSSFVTKDVYNEIGTFDTTYKCVADYDFMLRAFDSKRVTFIPIYKIIANFNDGGMSESLTGQLEELKLWRKRKTISGIMYGILSVLMPLKSWVYKMIWK